MLLNSALIWQPVNLVDRCLAYGDLESNCMMNIARQKLFNNFSRFLIPTQVVDPYRNKMREALQMDQMRMHFDDRNFV